MLHHVDSAVEFAETVYEIGDEVEIVVANTNTRLRQIDFDLAGVEKGYSTLLGKRKQEKKNLKSTKCNKKNTRKKTKRR